jgi:hypothetical protein
MNATAAYMQQRYGGNAAREYRTSPQNFRGGVAQDSAQATALGQTHSQYVTTRNSLQNDAALRQATVDSGRGALLTGRGNAMAPQYDYLSNRATADAAYGGALADAEARQNAAYMEAQGGIEQQRLRSLGDLGVAGMQYEGIGDERRANADRQYAQTDLDYLDAGRFGAQLPGGGVYTGRGQTYAPEITTVGSYDNAIDPTGRVVARGNTAYGGSDAELEAMMPQIAEVNPQQEGESDSAYIKRLASIANELRGIKE